MTRWIHLTSAVALGAALTLAAPAMAQNGNGNGNGNGRGGEARGQDMRGDQGRGNGNDNGNGRARAERGPSNDRSTALVEARPRDVERRIEREVERRVDRARDFDREVRRDLERRGVVYVDRDFDRYVVQGCPPGLAKKDNGCLPPGQARQLARTSVYDRYDYLWRRTNDDYRYRYDDGYLYRLDRQGGLLGYLPVLGGILSTGNPWPSQYAYDPAPTYITRYYGLPDRYQYRYADGVVYGVDPQTQAIGQIAALLTGQPINVGQPLPAGYDIYNVPYAYRSQYADGPDAWYRYNDGYVYRVDPTTQLVQAAIQLLT